MQGNIYPVTGRGGEQVFPITSDKAVVISGEENKRLSEKWNDIYSKEEVNQLIPNPNLLDNSDFKIWQRGTSFGVTAANTYTADRWTNGSGCTLFERTENGAKMTGASVMNALMFRQIMEHQNGTFDFTISAKVKSNGPFALVIETPGNYVDSETFPASDDFVEISAAFPSFNINNSIVRASIRSKQSSTLTVECAWMKLEHGLIATPWQPKGYGVELVECQRYYQIRTILYQSYQSQGSLIQIPFQYSLMRIGNPTGSFVGTPYYFNSSFSSIDIRSHGAAVNLTVGGTNGLVAFQGNVALSADL